MNAKERLTITKYMEMNRPANDTSLVDDFDDLVLRASKGDRRAVGAIAIALGKSLVAEARSVLKELDGDAEEVVQDFLLFLLEAEAPFNRANGQAMKWMHNMVRVIARQRLRERDQKRSEDEEWCWISD